jgi:hypothetical protein
MRYALIYSARLLALIITTALGVFFATCCAILGRLHYEMPSVIVRSDLIGTAVVGAGFVCCGALYVFLARKTPRKRPPF